MRLRRNEYCPIHRSVSCCGREQTPYARRLQPGVRRVDDPHHPRGYRELRSPAEMRKLLNRKIVEQDRKCAICHEEFTWEERGGMTTQTTFRQRISGAMKKKDQPEWLTDGP
jgi:hypothetical protein